MKIIHSKWTKQFGYIRAYVALRCDLCATEAAMSEYLLDGNCLPDGWSRAYTKDGAFCLQQDFCGKPACRDKAASMLDPELAPLKEQQEQQEEA